MEALSYILHKNIDKAKWDLKLSKCSNKLIYATSLYLDAMAGTWDAIIYGDYEILMPLPKRKKFGFHYMYTPAFVQQLGAFYCKIPHQTFFEDAFNLITAKANLVEYAMNYSNHFHINSAKQYFRNNFTLSLQASHSLLVSKQLPAFKKSMRRLQKHPFKYLESYSFIETILLYKQLYQSKQKGLKNRDYANFTALVKLLAKKHQVVCRQVVDTDNKLLGAALLLKDDVRLYNLIACVTPLGRQLEANYFLYHNIIKEFSNQNLVLDFEGSDEEGIANFYKKMGPENEPYPFLKINNLPKIVKLLKR